MALLLRALHYDFICDVYTSETEYHKLKLYISDKHIHIGWKKTEVKYNVLLN